MFVNQYHSSLNKIKYILIPQHSNVTFTPLSTDKTERSLVKSLLWEAEACRISDGIMGFPYYFGTVDRQPIRSFVTQFIGDPTTFRSCTLYKQADPRVKAHS